MCIRDSTKAEFMIHYTLCIIMMLVPSIMIILWHSSLLDLPVPDLEAAKEIIRVWCKKVTTYE